jgi:RNA polymerase sigma-70 factor, ECF subfamily
VPKASPHLSAVASPPGTAVSDLQPLQVERLPEHFDRLYRAAYGLCRTREDAEDLVQETYERVLRRPRFLRQGHDLAYLIRVMRNIWISDYRTRARGPVVEATDEVDFFVDPRGDTGLQAVEMRALYHAIGELPDAYRETLVAVDIVGLSYKEAARVLETSIGTVMSRLYRARDKVAQALEAPDAPATAQRRSL